MTASPCSNPRHLLDGLDVDSVPCCPIGTTCTSMKVGGHADLLVRPRTREALCTLARRCHEEGVPLRILGKGANLLVDDDGVDGVVVILDKPGFKDVAYGDPGNDAIHAGAGASLMTIVLESARRGLGGLSVLAGIPASIGGAIRMNAGGSSGCIGDSLHSITCLDAGGRIITVGHADLDFSYRSSQIPGTIVLSAVLRCTEEDPEAAKRDVKEFIHRKSRSQPMRDATAGCMFRNPKPPGMARRVSAGKLIDDAGLKGCSHGGAAVSDTHANFISTSHGATAGDVLALIDFVRTRVRDHAGIEMETEVVVWKRSKGNDG